MDSLTRALRSSSVGSAARYRQLQDSLYKASQVLLAGEKWQGQGLSRTATASVRLGLSTLKGIYTWGRGVCVLKFTEIFQCRCTT